MIRELDEHGIVNLLTHMISVAKMEFADAYLSYRAVHRCQPTEAEVKHAAKVYLRAKEFFYSPLFCAASPINGDEYVELLTKEVDRYGKTHLYYESNP